MHVWWSRPSGGGRLRDGVEEVLAPDERRRLDRLATSELHAERAWTRAWLRHVVAEYRDVSPRALRFEYGPAGKPRLEPDPERPPLHFNLSRSGGLAVLAVARGGAVGVDVEKVVPRRDLDVLIAECCSAREKRALRATDSTRLLGAFLLLWTRKEAYVKGLGVGLSLDPRALTIEECPHGRARIVPTDSPGRRSESPVLWSTDWSLLTLPLAPEYVATLAVSTPVTSVRVLEGTPP